MATEPDVRQDEFEAQLALLRLQFLAGLPARRAALLAAWAECADGGEEAPWRRLRDIAHKLSGSAPCYGLAAIGSMARELDQQLSGRNRCRERIFADARVERLIAALDGVAGGA